MHLAVRRTGMAEIKWQRGVFQQFRATTKIHLGGPEQDIFEDDIIEFDGQVAKIGGIDQPLSSLRGGIKAGWLVPITDTTTVYKPQPADIRVRPATAAGQERGDPMPIATATEEEALVGRLGDHQKRRESAFTGQRRRKPREQPPSAQPSSLADRRAALEAQMAALAVEEAAQPDPETEAVLMPIAVAPAQVTVISVPQPSRRQPSRRQLTVEEADEINRQRILEVTSQPVPPRPEPPPEMTAEERRQFSGTVAVEEQGGVPVGGYKFSGAVAGAEGQTRADPVDVTKVSAATIDARSRPVSTTPQTQIPAEGNVSITENLPGGATGDVAEAQSGDDLVQLLGNAAVAGPDPSNPLGWDTAGHWKTRVKMAVDKYGSSPEKMGQILAVETPTVRKHIQTEMKRRQV